MSTIRSQGINARERSGQELKILFLLWPLLSFIIALRNFKEKYARAVIIAFFSFFGFTLNFARETMDGFRHAAIFNSYAKISYADFKLIFLNIILLKSDSNDAQLDIYTVIVNFIFSRFTDSFHFVFLFHAFFYAYFVIKLIGVIYDEFDKKMNKNAFVFFAFLFFLIPISNIQSIRFPIATSIYIYGTFQLLKTGNKKFLLYCVLASLVHFSFILALLINLIYYFLGNKNYIYLTAIALSFIAPNLLYDYFGGLDKNTVGKGIQSKVSAYSNEDFLKSRNEHFNTKNWYSKYKVEILEYTYIFVLIVINVVRRFYYKQDKVQQNLISFLLLLFAFSNFGLAFDSLGRRFLLIWLVLANIFMFRFFQLNNYKNYYVYTVLFLIPISISIVFELRSSFDSMTYMSLIGNPFAAFFIETEAISK